MTVADQDVGPAVIVHIEKAYPPAQKLRVRAQACGERGVLEICSALIVVERGRIAGEVRLDQIQIAIHVIICSRDTHAGLRFTIGAQRAAGFDGDVLELAVLLVLVEGAGGGVIGNVNVGPAVVVEIGGQNAQAVGAIGVENP